MSAPAVAIDAGAIYATEQLEAMLGRTLWRGVKSRTRPLVKGRYFGQAVLAALELINAERQAGVIDARPRVRTTPTAPKRKTKPAAGINLVDGMRVRIKP